MWSMLWNFLIFSQGIPPWKVVGVLMVVVGVIVMNSETVTKDEDEVKEEK